MSDLTIETLVKGLRDCADWMEKHPSMPLPYDPKLQIFSINTKQQVAELARHMGQCDKTYSEEMFSVTKHFGPFRVEGVAYRSQVCERVVVGYESVTIPAQPAKPEQTIAKEIVEWKCGSVMTPAELAGERLIEAPPALAISGEVLF